jgi:ParB family chromosome partitioning protein
MSGISIDKLTPHPSNNLFFDDLVGEDWEAFLNDVREHGIRDPLRITTDFQVICGHQRLRAAAELGYLTVPVIMEDIKSIEEVERLLVDDNLHRRHLTPIQKGKLAATLKERWGVKRGGNQKAKDQNGLSDVAETIGESLTTTKRLIKLNDLIPELKKLIDSKKLGTTFGEKLSALTPDEQTKLHQVFGEEIGKTAKLESEAFINETVEYEKAQIEKKYKDVFPKDLIPDIESAAVERLQEETTALLATKEKEKSTLLKRLEDEWKERMKAEQDKHKFEKEQIQFGYNQIKEENKALKLQNKDDDNSEASEQHLKKIQREADINTVPVRNAFKVFIEKAAVTPFIFAAMTTASEYEKERFQELIDMARQIIDQADSAIKGRKVGDNK